MEHAYDLLYENEEIYHSRSAVHDPLGLVFDPNALSGIPEERPYSVLTDLLDNKPEPKSNHYKE